MPKTPSSALPQVPAYFNGLLHAFAAGAWGRHVHLGYWDTEPSPQTLAQPGSHVRAMARLDDCVLAQADLADGQRVIDVGCGLGGTLQVLDARHSRLSLTGVNIDPRQLAACSSLRPRESNRMDWVLADATRLPFLESTFDRMFCIEAMFHFPSRHGFLLEAERVLAPGGVLVATDIMVDAARAPPEDAAALLAGFGPWPDLEPSESSAKAMSLDVPGLHVTRRTDITTNTAPSHVFTAPGIERADDPISRACHALRRLHERSALRIELLRWDRLP